MTSSRRMAKGISLKNLIHAWDAKFLRKSVNSYFEKLHQGTKAFLIHFPKSEAHPYAKSLGLANKRIV